MKKTLGKDTVQEIKHTFKRFLSILIMAFLGVGFFAGIRATSPDMVESLDKYFKERNTYDIEVVSTLGLKETDVEALKKIENVESVYGTYQTDCIINTKEAELVTKIMCIEKTNTPLVISGRLPEDETECVVEESFLTNNKKQLGDKVEVEIDKTTNDDGEEIEYLKQKKLTIVGTVRSPMYISRERGTSKLGAGEVDYFMYIDKSNVNAKDIYSNIYIKVKNSENYVTSSEEYENYINSVKDDIEKIKNEREQSRYNQLIETSTKKVTDAENKLAEEKENAQEKISEAEQEINNAKKEIEDGEKEITENEQKANKEFTNAKVQIEDAKKQIEQGEIELEEKQNEANLQIQEAENKKTELKTQLNQINNGITSVQEGIAQIEKALENPLLPAAQRVILEQKKENLEQQLQELKNNKIQIENGILQIENGINEAKIKLQEGSEQLNNSKLEIQEQEKILKQEETKAKKEIQQAKVTLNEAKQKIEDGEKELEENKKEFNEKINEAEGKLIDAKEKISEIEKPSWYILDRNSNYGYASFIQDTESLKNIGLVFPLVFFVIATLISLTSMTRMVEEERTQIGTLKALGYNKVQIAEKYVIYAALASVTGGVLGMYVGFVSIPRIIWNMYAMMYNLPKFYANFNFEFGMIGNIAASGCIIGATIYAVSKELIQTPAVLMRPKVPKNGKRVMLEKVTFIWKRLSFTRKVTVRNIFRYKKRFLMTIIGIFGCTSLIIAGFGLRDSIRSILPAQFENVFTYDTQINLKNNLEKEQVDNLISKLKNKKEIREIVETKIIAVDAINGNKTESLQMIIPDSQEEMDKMIHLKDVDTKKQVKLNENQIVITDKVAQLLGVKKGDKLTLEYDKERKEFEISNIVENYISHYIYMSKELYESSYEKYETNVIYTQNIDLSKEGEESLSKELMKENEISSVTQTSATMSAFDDTLNSLNYVVVVLIVSAGLLAFVVLYNLANVNISERIRELATIKVLGFYDKEVYNYVARETILLTAMGIILGCIGGYFLNAFILGTCEINILRFVKIVEPMSYIYSILITIGFTAIVNVATYFSLKKIDMIESLKSVE